MTAAKKKRESKQAKAERAKAERAKAERAKAERAASEQAEAAQAEAQSFTSTLRWLAALGAASALWAVFLWRELLRARAGETPFCGFGESADCGDLWSAAFAGTVHHSTGLPVAGWGLIWGLVATFLPLATLVSRQREDRAAATASAIDLTAAAGAGGIVVLLAASAAEGLFCVSCALTYVFTLAYAVLTFLRLRSRPWPRSPQGVTWAVAATGAAYLLLLYPGSKTPKSLNEEGQRALAAVERKAIARSNPAPVEPTPGGAAQPAPSGENDAALRDFLASLPPPALQGLSDSLDLFRNAPDLEPEEPRVVALGPQDGRVLITEFTDVLCSHCATLHQTMAYLSTLLPPDSFRLDARHFPLDGNCNAYLPRRGPESVRCLAAKAQICVEDSGQGFKLASTLFSNQRDLKSDQVFALAASLISRTDLEDCVADPTTERKLRDDVAYAWRHEPEGTPLVLIDGRRGTQFGPFLYAMVLAAGRADHPAFASLPPPSAELTTSG